MATPSRRYSTVLRQPHWQRRRRGAAQGGAGRVGGRAGAGGRAVQSFLSSVAPAPVPLALPQHPFFLPTGGAPVGGGVVGFTFSVRAVGAASGGGEGGVGRPVAAATALDSSAPPLTAAALPPVRHPAVEVRVHGRGGGGGGAVEQRGRGVEGGGHGRRRPPRAHGGRDRPPPDGHDKGGRARGRASVVTRGGGSRSSGLPHSSSCKRQ